MNRWFAIAAAVAQVLVLGFMAGQREWIVRSGQAVVVRTAPIDPRDPMRGDYARLEYEISTVPRALCCDGVATWFDDDTIYSRDIRDRRVYASLELDESGIASVVALSDREPEGGLFLRGRTDWIEARTIHVRYGIEALFMEQGAALDFERAVRDEKAGVPINAEIAVGSGGTAVLRSTRWEPLGLVVRILRRESIAGGNERDANQRSGAIGAVVTLKNHSDAPVAIVDLPHAGSLRLIAADRRGDGAYLPVERSSPPSALRAADSVLLQPGESREITIDFTSAEWFVTKESAVGETSAGPVSMETITDGWSAWFRIEYAPPSAGACAGLPHADAIRHARLRSRSFSPAGGFD